MKLVVFIGPQGVGKTTLARFLVRQLLSKGFKICYVKLIDYTIFHHKYLMLFKLVVKGSDLLKVFSKLFPLYIFMHFTGLLMSVTKAKFFQLIEKCDILIEDEGFIFKEIPDLYFIVGVTGSWRERVNRYIIKYFLKFLIMELNRIAKSCVVIYVNAPYNILEMRYVERGKAEPKLYIDFQNSLYKIMIQHLNTICKVSCHQLYIENVGRISVLDLVNSIMESFKETR